MALGLAYDGGPWQGWQTQPSRQTVQDALEGALAKFLASPASTICAGRTDAGVHALNQVVHLDTSVERRIESWIRGVNAHLPDSIAVQWAKPVDDSFHARFSAQARTYIYVVRNARQPSPLMQGKVGWVYHPLELARMQAAAAFLLGEHDFSAFRSADCQAASPVRTIETLRIEQQGCFYIFTFRANAFLHHMVRNIMGALLYVGQGRQPIDWTQSLLQQRDRRLAAPTFTGAGLYLAGVDYPPQYELPTTEPQRRLHELLGMRLESIL